VVAVANEAAEAKEAVAKQAAEAKEAAAKQAAAKQAAEAKQAAAKQAAAKQAAAKQAAEAKEAAAKQAAEAKETAAKEAAEAKETAATQAAEAVAEPVHGSIKMSKSNKATSVPGSTEINQLVTKHPGFGLLKFLTVPDQGSCVWMVLLLIEEYQNRCDSESPFNGSDGILTKKLAAHLGKFLKSKVLLMASMERAQKRLTGTPIGTSLTKAMVHMKANSGQNWMVLEGDLRGFALDVQEYYRTSSITITHAIEEQKITYVMMDRNSSLPFAVVENFTVASTHEMATSSHCSVVFGSARCYP
jgi:flagellar biosynthesis GTPase FlhF